MKQLTYEQAIKRPILILVGRGKSVLTDFIKSADTICGIKSLIKRENYIKENCDGIDYVIHLDSEDDIKKIPAGIKRRSVIFKIDF
jgi:hypothetical protein